jgi:basic membrane protein A and related proteins
MLNKKVKLTAAIFAVGLVAAACGSDTKTATPSASEAPAAGASTAPSDSKAPADTTAPVDTATATTGATAGGDCKGGPMTILFDLKGRGDKSFNDSAAVGLDKAKAEFGYTVTENVRAGSDEAELFKKAADAKQALVIGVGFAFGESMSAAAKANPDVHYAIVDSPAGDDKNVSGLLFKANEGSYLVGAAAALKSKTAHIGFIGGVDIPLIQDFFKGYEAGAKSVKADIKIDTAYISPAGDFSGFGAPDKAKTIAAKMYQDGADVVYHAAGSSGDGLFSAAKEANAAGNKVWAIGVDSDQAQTSSADLAPYILTSMIKHVDVAVYETMKDNACGKFAGGDRVFSVKDGGLDYATTGGNVDDIKDQLEKIKTDIGSGAIKVPSGF